jgi:hypothetical protein
MCYKTSHNVDANQKKERFGLKQLQCIEPHAQLMWDPTAIKKNNFSLPLSYPSRCVCSFLFMLCQKRSEPTACITFLFCQHEEWMLYNELNRLIA